jgi:hypothetical protein
MGAVSECFLPLGGSKGGWGGALRQLPKGVLYIAMFDVSEHPRLERACCTCLLNSRHRMWTGCAGCSYFTGAR